MKRQYITIVSKETMDNIINSTIYKGLPKDKWLDLADTTQCIHRSSTDIITIVGGRYDQIRVPHELIKNKEA